MQPLILTTFLVHLLLTGLFLGFNSALGKSFGLGGLLLILALSITSLGFHWIFDKKRIALGIGTIVIKYAVLGLICWQISLWGRSEKIAVLSSFISLAFGSIAYALYDSYKQKRDTYVI